MNMKDFDGWNELKKKLELASPPAFFFQEGQIWWCSLGLNIGSEQDGKNNLFERPVIILKRFNDQMFFVLPLTSNIRKARYYYYQRKNESVILSQARPVSTKRFQRYIETLSESELEQIRRAFIELFR